MLQNTTDARCDPCRSPERSGRDLNRGAGRITPRSVNLCRLPIPQQETSLARATSPAQTPDAVREAIGARRGRLRWPLSSTSWVLEQIQVDFEALSGAVPIVFGLGPSTADVLVSAA